MSVWSEAAADIQAIAGEAATYIPPDGQPPMPCTAVLSDTLQQTGDQYPITEGGGFITLLVSEVPDPVKGGVVVLEESARTYTLTRQTGRTRGIDSTWAVREGD